MSRRASRRISSQTSNWMRTWTEPCRALACVWLGAGDGAGDGASRVVFSVSINSAFFRGAWRTGPKRRVRTRVAGGRRYSSIVPEKAWDGQGTDKSMKDNSLYTTVSLNALASGGCTANVPGLE